MKTTKLKTLFFLLSVFGFVFAANADTHATTATVQNASYLLKGTVVDNIGDPLIGANVMVAGTTEGVITDLDGNFSIRVSRGFTLNIKYLGYKDVALLITDQQNVRIVLHEDATQLEDVVIVGYGSQKKASVVGSVQTIKPDELRVPSTNLSNSFAGRLAGVIAVQRSGEPGADGSDYWIRGVATTSGVSSPLIIIDGVQASAGDLNNVAPEMIESFSILKDATATALYGTLGANGVLILNTKSGVTSGKPIINVRVEQNFKTPLKVPETVGGAEYMKLYNEAYYNRGGGAKDPFSAEKIAGTEAGYDNLIFPDVDWYNEMFKNISYAQDVNFNVRGGGEKADYFLGVNVSHETGMLKSLSQDFYSFDNNIDVMKYNFQNNINVRLSNTSKIYLRLNVQLQDYTGPKENASTIFNQIMSTNPVDYPIYYPQDDSRRIFVGHEDDATYNPMHVLWGGNTSTDLHNPVAKMTSGYSNNFKSTVIATLGFDQKLDFIIKGLSANGLFSFKNYSYTGVNRAFSNYNRYYINSAAGMDNGYVMDETGAITQYAIQLAGTESSQVLNTKSSTSGDRTIYIQGQLNYDRTFNKKHAVQAMLLYNQREFNVNNPEDDLFKALAKRKQGFAGRASYAYDQRYLAEVNFGLNGSENFAKGNRFGFFPSVALGYNISREEYWKPIEHIVSNLKVRASYGLVGNDQSSSDRFLYMAKLSLQSSDRGYTTGTEGNYKTLNGPKYIRYANENLTWEIGEKLNLGADIQLFNSVNIMVDVFREYRYNIFAQRGTIPNFLGTAGTNIYGNLTEVLNRGFDLAVNYDKKINEDWFISARGTLTFARNKIVKLDEPEYQRYPNVSKLGHQINQVALYVADGLYIDEADVANSAKSDENVKPGDIKYVNMADVNGVYDGVIDGNDRIYTGYPTTPEMVYGFGASAQYRKWDASIFFQGTARVSLIMENFHPFGTSNSKQINNVLTWVAADRWDPDNPNPNAKYPALSARENTNTTLKSTFWQRDASFLKLKNVEIGFSHKFFRVYATGSNLLTFSKFKLWDPEQGGGSGLKYPNQRTFNVGMQMNF